VPEPRDQGADQEAVPIRGVVVLLAGVATVSLVVTGILAGAAATGAESLFNIIAWIIPSMGVAFALVMASVGTFAVSRMMKSQASGTATAGPQDAADLRERALSETQEVKETAQGMPTEENKAVVRRESGEIFTQGGGAPDTIVLIHGLWVTPRSWEHWIERYEGRGYRVLAPAYPGLEVEVEALREDPSPIEALTVPAIVEHLEGIVGELERPPIIMGHSFGGLLTQILLDHGYGAAGVAIDSVPAEGIKVTPVSQIRSFFPILKNPANRMKAVGFTPEQFHFAFANTLSEEESQEVYDRYHIPAPGRLVWGGVLANFIPGHQDTYVNFRNEDRAPLLFIAGGEDNLMPPAVNESNVKHYRYTKSITDYKEFPGRSHYDIVGGEGWEEVADYALEWAVEHATTRPAV
jgi:pimeloyl-ACP methyl ester carboxylesterase